MACLQAICPTCGDLAETLPSGRFAACPRCELVGCDNCLPAGRGCLCPACEESEEDRFPGGFYRPNAEGAEDR